MIGKSKNLRAKDRLQQGLLLAAFANLLVVSLLGLLLRTFPFLSSFPLSYKNLLHGHSHFAFGGWVLPVLLSLVMKAFPALKDRIAFRHWRNIAAMVLLSAYGMLLSFPVQGYKAVSISFSTLSIAATVYLAVVVWKAAKGWKQTTSLLFLKWGLLYAALSSLGPFATGPLIAMGKGGSPLYFDAIYFYLHFQYNGFFTFAVLALLYQKLEQRGFATNGKKIFYLFNAACLPTYALSVLWHQPPVLFHFVGGIGALLQLGGVFFLLKDLAAGKGLQQSFLTKLVISFLVLKNVLQLFSAVPAVALLAYHNRDFVIAYLHLVLLGFVSLYVFERTVQRNPYSRYGMAAFLLSFVTTETLLVLHAFSGLLRFDLPFYPLLLLLCSLFFPLGIVLLILGLQRKELQQEEKAQNSVLASSPVL